MNRFAHQESKSQALKAEEMLNQIKDVVYEYAEIVPLALAVGVLDIAKDEIKEESSGE